MNSQNGNRLKVGICGGGLVGVCLASALTKYPHIDVSVFEGGPSISETGAGIGIAANAQTALQLIRPELYDALRLAGAHKMEPSYRFIMAEGERTGELIVDVNLETPELALNRGRLLEQFVKTVPPEVLHVNKKLTKIEKMADGRLMLHFKDGSTEAVDALVGTDGIHSITRRYVLGAQDPSFESTFSGIYLCANLVPMELAQDKMGDLRTSGTCLTGYLGKGGYLMNVQVGDMMMVLAQMVADDKNAKVDWVGAVTRADLDKYYGTWGSMGKSIVELLLQDPNLFKRAIMEFRDTRTFSKENVCMVGDSAHAMQPWVGAGAAMGIEDVLVLEKLLGKVHSRVEIAPAFKAYDAIRRPRAHSVAETSRRLGRVVTGQERDVRFEFEDLAKAIPAQWSWVTDIDLETHVKQAEETFTKLCKDVQEN